MERLSSCKRSASRPVQAVPFLRPLAALALALALFPCARTPVAALDTVRTGDTLKDSALQANRRTALRCLSLANDYASAKNWQAVVAQASLGLSYDATLSDLWYMLAVAQDKLGKTKAEVSACVERAIAGNNWVNYNRDSARILYADILCDTGRFAEVFAVLDGRFSRAQDYVDAPYIYSADAEYIRAKAYYRLGDVTSVALAREKIDDSRQVYPEDTRFPLLFFKNESPARADGQVARIASQFIADIKDYASPDPDKEAELEILAASFADPDTQRVMLQSFAARGLRHPLYATLALRAGLITQKQALDYVCGFADDAIRYDQLMQALSLLDDAGTKEDAAAYLNAFNGVILFDTTGDGIENLLAKYSRGRPQTLFYDANQDGSYEWTVACDFGVPTGGTLHGRSMDVTWGAFPYLRTVVFRGSAGEPLESFSLVADACAWTPVLIQPDRAVADATGAEFFVPVVNAEPYAVPYERGPAGEEIIGMQASSGAPTLQTLLNAANRITIPSAEREQAEITFSVLRGKIISAQYRQGGTLYAQAEFVDGIPQVRLVDGDGDGVFETSEFYAVDTDGDREVHSLEDERAIMTMLYGTPSSVGPYYLRMVQVDTDADTVPDYTEEYLVRGGKISSWDTDGDGLWNIRLARLPRSSSADRVVEQAMFYDADRQLVTVTTVDGIPEEVACGTERLSVTEDERYRFYWLGQVGSTELAKAALQALNRRGGQGNSVVVQDAQFRALAIRIGETCYGKIVDNVQEQ